MLKITRLKVIIAFIIVVAIAIVGVFLADALTIKQQPPSALPLIKTFDESPTGFAFDYPEDWNYMIPSIGLLMAGPPETIFQAQPGPTFTVQRSVPLSVKSLNEAMTDYLQKGPLRENVHWKLTSDITPTTFLGRDALIVELEGSDVEGASPLKTRILVTSAKNTLIYLFITAAPVESFDSFEPTLNAMLESVVILE